MGSLFIYESLSDYCSKCRIGKLEFKFASHKIPDTFNEFVMRIEMTCKMFTYATSGNDDSDLCLGRDTH